MEAQSRRSHPWWRPESGRRWLTNASSVRGFAHTLGQMTLPGPLTLTLLLSSSGYGNFLWRYTWTRRWKMLLFGHGMSPVSTQQHRLTGCFVWVGFGSALPRPSGNVGRRCPVGSSCGSRCNIAFGLRIGELDMGYKTKPPRATFVIRTRTMWITSCFSACMPDMCGFFVSTGSE